MTPTPGPPEYKVYRARRKPLARGGDLDALRKRLSRNRVTATSRAQPRDRPPITPGRVLKWVALAIAGWLLLSLVLFLISAQTQDGVSPETERALSEQRQPLHRQQHPRARLRRAHRATRSTSPSPGPGRSDTIMLVHSAFGSVRKLSIPRDVEVEVPGPRDQQDQRRLRARRAGAHDRDGGVVPRQRPRGEPPRRGRLRELPRLHRLARRRDR